MKKLQPELAQIRKNCKGNKQLESLQTMDLYKRYNVKPAGSFLTLLIQLPIFIAIFGAILIYSGVKMFVNKGEEKIDTANHPAVKFASRFFPVTRELHEHRFFVHLDGRTFMTPLFLVLVVIEFSDIIFAVDSIPAVFSVTTDPYIVFFSNIFAIMGLRSLFFLLSNVTDKFWLLRYGLGLLLCFIGVKMIGHEFFGLHISTIQSLLAILGILVGSVLLSLIIPHRSRGQVQSE